MASIGHINNSESGSSARDKINQSITEANKVEGKISEILEDVTPQLGGDLDVNGNRILAEQGDDIASANNLTLDSTVNGNTYGITGTTQINLIEVLDWQDGAEVTLHFIGSLVIAHGATLSGNFAPIYLAKGADYTTSAGDTISFRLINGEWWEVSNTKEGGSSILNKYDATTAPTVTNDSNEGYQVGSEWIDTTADKAYKCLDASVGAAVWTETTQAGGGGGSLAISENDGTQYTESQLDIESANSEQVLTNDSGVKNVYTPKIKAATDLDATGESAGNLVQRNSTNDGYDYAQTEPFDGALFSVEANLNADGQLSTIVLADYSLVGVRVVGDGAATAGTLKLGTTSLGAEVGELLLATDTDEYLPLSISWFSKINDTDLYISGITAGLVSLEFTMEKGVRSLGSIASKNFWTGTQAEYDALGTYDVNTIYFVEA